MFPNEYFFPYQLDVNNVNLYKINSYYFIGPSDPLIYLNRTYNKWYICKSTHKHFQHLFINEKINNQRKKYLINKKNF